MLTEIYIEGLSAAVESRSGFFSVSPMYLFTIEDKSILKKLSHSAPAMNSAAMILPVPGELATSELTSCPSQSFGPKPHVPRTQPAWRLQECLHIPV